MPSTNLYLEYNFSQNGGSRDVEQVWYAFPRGAWERGTTARQYVIGIAIDFSIPIISFPSSCLGTHICVTNIIVCYLDCIGIFFFKVLEVCTYLFLQLFCVCPCTPQGGIELNVSGVSQARLLVAKKKQFARRAFMLTELLRLGELE